MTATEVVFLVIVCIEAVGLLILAVMLWAKSNAIDDLMNSNLSLSVTIAKLRRELAGVLDQAEVEGMTDDALLDESLRD